jgi:imidazoleglycerol-phosphate dehydratase/histidinol-phosphatase
VSRKILFVDRDGTLVIEPADGRVDSFAKLAFVPGVIPALLRFKAAGYELVVVSNQDGLGTREFPRARFDEVDSVVRGVFASQGIEFAEVLYCPHEAEAGCDCRKPALGLVRKYLAPGLLDQRESAVVGDRDTDLELAQNLGLRGFKVGGEGFMQTWEGIAHAVLDAPRTATVTRKTRETEITVAVALDREADAQAQTGIGFFDHMLEQLGKHARPSAA